MLVENFRILDEEDVGLRLDVFLFEHTQGYSRSKIQKYIKSKCVRLTRKKFTFKSLKPAEILKIDDTISVEFPEIEKKEVLPEEIQLDILHEDNDILIINKASGMIIHPAETVHSGTLVNALLAYNSKVFNKLIDKEQKYIRPGIVHRLDKDTSGVMVVAKNKMSLEHLKNDFAQREVEKIYIALVWGEPKEQQGTIQTYIARSKSRFDKMDNFDEENQGKIAITQYKKIATTNGVSLMKFRLETGRTHQIRLHCKKLAIPIIGDLLYGNKQKDAKLNFSNLRLLLHSWRLKLYHPRDGELCSYTADILEDFKDIAKHFQISIDS